MLGKLFGFGKKDKPATPQRAAPAIHQHKVKMPAPSLLEALTASQPLNSITDASTLHQLVKHSDKLDKKTNRQVRERINALKEQEKQRQQLHDAQEKICTRLETLARLQYHPLFDSELAHLQQQWQTISHVDTNIATRIHAAVARCIQIQEEDKKLKQLQETLLQESEQRILQQQALNVERSEQRAMQAEQYAILQETKKQQLQQSQTDREKHEKSQQEISHNLAKQLTALEEAINNAEGKKARELLEKSRDCMKKLDAKHHHAFDGKLHLLSGQLRELQDWQAFAAMPKLEELCTEMEKMISAALPPLQKADAIRELQNQWRSIKAPSNKQAQALWERFKQAGETAWEPCAAYYEKEKQLRAFNLQQRQTICEALEQFFTNQNWDKADWKTVARILDKSRQEFHDFHPVERGEEKAIRSRFDAALNTINSKLLEEQKINEDKKRQLVETATSIANMVDLDKATERVKQLQEQWKLIGITRRNEDQKLWQQLQEQITIVFEKRRSNQQQQRQTENDNVEQAKALCAQIAALAALPDHELSQSGAEFDRLQHEYKSITTGMNDKNQQFLKKPFYAACDTYRQQLAGINQRQHRLHLQELARRAQLCQQLETQASDTNLTALQEKWQLQTLPAEWERAIDKRRQQAITAAQQGEQPDRTANEQKLRELCIALEILLDAETPEADRPLRREYQLQKLQQGLGQAAASNRHELIEQLLVQWYCASPANHDAQMALQARFDAAQKAGGQ